MEKNKIPLPELIQAVKTRLQELQYRQATINSFLGYTDAEAHMETVRGTALWIINRGKMLP